LRDYSGWSFGDRSFLMALGISLLWHFFWFFSITITVDSSKRFSHQPRPKIVSLGPVLDDAIFRTLTQNKPQLSETFYRRISDFSSPLDLQVKTMERFSSGEVVGLPASKKFLSSLRGLVGGAKTSPDYAPVTHEAPALGVSYETSEIEGEASHRQLLSRPEEPLFPLGLDPALKDSEAELQFAVDPSGVVTHAEILLSSGNPDLDLIWVRYVRHWQFSILSETNKLAGAQTGKIRLRFSRSTGK